MPPLSSHRFLNHWIYLTSRRHSLFPISERFSLPCEPNPPSLSDAFELKDTETPKHISVKTMNLSSFLTHTLSALCFALAFSTFSFAQETCNVETEDLVLEQAFEGDFSNTEELVFLNGAISVEETGALRVVDETIVGRATSAWFEDSIRLAEGFTAAFTVFVQGRSVVSTLLFLLRCQPPSIAEPCFTCELD